MTTDAHTTSAVLMKRASVKPGASFTINPPPASLARIQATIAREKPLRKDAKVNSQLMSSLFLSGVDAEELNASFHQRLEVDYDVAYQPSRYAISHAGTLTAHTGSGVDREELPNKSGEILDKWKEVLINVGLPIHHIFPNEPEILSSRLRSLANGSRHTRDNQKLLKPILQQLSNKHPNFHRNIVSKIDHVSVRQQLKSPPNIRTNGDQIAANASSAATVDSHVQSALGTHKSRTASLTRLNGLDSQVMVDGTISKKYFGVNARNDFFDQFRELTRQGRNLITENEIKFSSSSSRLRGVHPPGRLFGESNTAADSQRLEYHASELSNTRIATSTGGMSAFSASVINTVDESKIEGLNSAGRSTDFSHELHAWSGEYSQLFSAIDESILTRNLPHKIPPSRLKNALALSEMQTRPELTVGFNDDDDQVSKTGHLEDLSAMLAASRASLSSPNVSAVEGRLKALNRATLSDLSSETAHEVGLTPVSPRSQYLSHCIREGVTPLSNLVLRKHLTTTLNLSRYGMGDRMANILAKCISDLPELEFVNLSDNQLSDASIPHLLLALLQVSSLKQLDISRNDIDRLSSDALAAFLASPNCPIHTLTIEKADIDDAECCRIIAALRNNKKLRELNLCNNLIGTAENRNAVDSKFETGGESIGSFIASSGCQLTTLKLGWNSIRSDSANLLAGQIALTRTLTHLDLSDNGMGNEAGEILGSSLMENKSLKALIVPNNNFHATACLCLVAGFIENETMYELVMDDNPIGMSGAKGLMQIPIFTGVNAAISAKSCNTTIKHPKDWFDIAAPLGRYALDLSVPYERAIAICLLQIIASHSSYKVSKAVYENEKKKKEVIKLVQSTSTDRDKVFDPCQKSTMASLQLIAVAAGNFEVAYQLFTEMDVDDSGELDKFEVAGLLSRIGLPNDEAEIRKIFSNYDAEGSGMLDITEFMNYLAARTDEAAMRIKEMLELPMLSQESNQAVKYRPPKIGFLHIEVTDGFIQKEKFKVLSEIDRNNLINLALRIGYPAVLLESLKNIKLRFNEAVEVFEVCSKNTGNVVKTLVDLLPLMESTGDAVKLLMHICSDSKHLLASAKLSAGNALRPLLGDFNGYYHLNLKHAMDKLCFQRLLTHSLTLQMKQKSHQFSNELGAVGDLSQHRNWSCFRNEYHNGKPIIVDGMNSSQIPTSGILEFDFACSGRPKKPSEQVSVVSDKRMMQILSNLAFVERSDDAASLALLKKWKQMSHYKDRSHGDGEAGRGKQSRLPRPMAAFDVKKAGAVGKAMDKFYDKLSKRFRLTKAAIKSEQIHISYLESAIENVVTETVVKTKQKAMKMNTREKLQSHLVSTATKNIENAHKAAALEGDQTHNISQEDDSDHDNDSDGEDPDNDNDNDDDETDKEIDGGEELRPDEGNRESFDEFESMLAEKEYGEDVVSIDEEDTRSLGSAVSSCAGSSIATTKTAQKRQVVVRDMHHRIKMLMKNTSISPHAKGHRMSETVRETFLGLWIRSRHLALLVKLFSECHGKTKRTPYFGSYLVDVTVSLFYRVIDVHNFELVLGMLNAQDCAAVLCRLGILHIFNPCKPEGALEVCMSRPEERIVAKIISYLSNQEPGINLGYQTLQWKRDLPVTPGWQLNEGWLKEESLPSNGYFNYLYISGGSCVPVPDLRRALLQLVTIEEWEIDLPEYDLKTDDEDTSSIASSSCTADQKPDAVPSSSVDKNYNTSSTSTTLAALFVQQKGMSLANSAAPPPPTTAFVHFQKNKSIWCDYLVSENM